MHRARRRPNRRPFLVRLAVVVGAVLLVALAGCGAAVPSAAQHSAGDDLLAGGWAASPTGLGDAAHLAGRFARLYAGHAYGRRAPMIGAEGGAVRRALVAAAGRVPPTRRRLRPHLLGLRLALSPGGHALNATARIDDGRFPPFTIGFTIAPRGGHWLVTSISLPG